MRKLQLQSVLFRSLEEGFKSWLSTIGYNKQTVNYNPLSVREFLHYLEQKHPRKRSLDIINKRHANDYIDYLSKRSNQRRSGALSYHTIKNNVQALRRFSVYLKNSKGYIFETDILLPKKHITHHEILSRKEMKELYSVIPDDPAGLRDKAILSIFYGCGLRRNEGTSLDVKDVLLQRNLIHVRKGKNYRERYVPISQGVRKYLAVYLRFSRPYFFLPDCRQASPEMNEEAFFLSKNGTRLSSDFIYNRVKQILQNSGINKNAGLHSLRHSIATHLLQSGMELEKISKFLGHSSLESTQLYTHLSADQEDLSAELQ